MSESIALELPEPLAKKVKEIAALNRQGIEEMLIEWIDRTINEIPIDTLPDEQVLALCNLQMGEQQQRVFSNLQARNSEGLLNAQEVKKLNELMQVYRHGSVRKAKAIQVAVMRGLIPSEITHNLESNSDRQFINFQLDHRHTSNEQYPRH